jgi:hypothetical protein
MCVLRCVVFITAVPITKLFAGGWVVGGGGVFITAIPITKKAVRAGVFITAAPYKCVVDYFGVTVLCIGEKNKKKMAGSHRRSWQAIGILGAFICVCIRINGGME